MIRRMLPAASPVARRWRWICCITSWSIHVAVSAAACAAGPPSTEPAAPAPASPASAAPTLAITDVTVIDVARGRALTPRTVLIRGDRILSLDEPSRLPIPAGAERLDGRGRFLIPGLLDLHVHLFNNASRRPPNTWAFPLFVAHGVTGVREMAATAAAMPQIHAWRAAIARGELVAPHLLAVGVVIGATADTDANAELDPDADVVPRIAAAAAAGADFLKIYSDLSAARWRAILAAARPRAIPVAGHVPAGVSLLSAAAAGQRSNEHLTQAFEACTAAEPALLTARLPLRGEPLLTARDADEPRVLASFDPPTCQRVAAALAALRQPQVPTLVLPFVEAHPPVAPERDPRWPTLRADERARWLRIWKSLPADAVALAPRRWDVARQITAAFHRAGVPILAGTDAPMPGVYPGSSLHEELELLVAAGLDPAAALRAATCDAAALLGRSIDAGSIAAGRRADLVLLDADPLRDIRATRRIHAVVLAGRLLRRPALDALLASPPD